MSPVAWDCDLENIYFCVCFPMACLVRFIGPTGGIKKAMSAPADQKADEEMNSQTSKLTKDWSARLEDHGQQEAMHIGRFRLF